MSTQAKIKIESHGKLICSAFYPMDGHIQNWAPSLAAALSKTGPDDIRRLRKLLRFLCADVARDDHLDYLCRVNLLDNGYQFTIHDYNGRLLFDGNLQQFTDKYVDDDW